MTTWVMCNPVMAKNVAPNSGTPHSLPKGVTCSLLIRFIHSVRCRPTKVAPAAIVARIQRAAAERFPLFMATMAAGATFVGLHLTEWMNLINNEHVTPFGNE